MEGPELAAKLAGWATPVDVVEIDAHNIAVKFPNGEVVQLTISDPAAPEELFPTPPHGIEESPDTGCSTCNRQPGEDYTIGCPGCFTDEHSDA